VGALVGLAGAAAPEPPDGETIRLARRLFG
jgi:hypothetical protein